MKREKQINMVVRTLYLLKYAFTSKLLYRFTGYDNVTNYFCSNDVLDCLKCAILAYPC